MKFTSAIALILALSASCFGTAQSVDMKGMDMKDMEMKDTGDKPETNGSRTTIHQMKAVVKAVDAANGKVTLAHEPVKSLNWPAMTMNFSVKDKALFDNLPVGKRVEVEFVQQGSDYVVTRVK
jgi:Cu(I)/Ag(I) efflux system periplasmic protein CusF